MCVCLSLKSICHVMFLCNHPSLPHSLSRSPLPPVFQPLHFLSPHPLPQWLYNACSFVTGWAPVHTPTSNQALPSQTAPPPPPTHTPPTPTTHALSSAPWMLPSSRCFKISPNSLTQTTTSSSPSSSHCWSGCGRPADRWADPQTPPGSPVGGGSSPYPSPCPVYPPSPPSSLGGRRLLYRGGLCRGGHFTLGIDR